MALKIQRKGDSSIIACCDDVKIVEHAWYYHPSKVEMQYLTKTDRTYNCPYKGIAYWYDLELGNGDVARNVAWVYEDPMKGFEHIAGLIAFHERETSATVALHEASA